MLCFDTKLSDDELCDRLAEHKIHLSPLSQYFHDSVAPTKHMFVLTYSNIDLDNLNDALEVVFKYLKK